MPNATQASVSPPFGRILRIGSRGEQPVAVKRALARAGFGSLDSPLVGQEVLGPFGVRNLKAFQKDHGLVVDGVYGPHTHAELTPYFDDYAYLLYTGHPRPSMLKVQLPYPYVGTHHTSGLGWPGLDAIDVFAPPGTRVLAPLAGTLRWTHMIDWDGNARVGGMTTYLEAAEGTFFLTHFADVLPTGTTLRQGQDMGSVAAVPHGWWAPHIHEGFRAADAVGGGRAR